MEPSNVAANATEETLCYGFSFEAMLPIKAVRAVHERRVHADLEQRVKRALEPFAFTRTLYVTQRPFFRTYVTMAKLTVFTEDVDMFESFKQTMIDAINAVADAHPRTLDCVCAIGKLEPCSKEALITRMNNTVVSFGVAELDFPLLRASAGH